MPYASRRIPCSLACRGGGGGGGGDSEVVNEGLSQASSTVDRYSNVDDIYSGNIQQKHSTHCKRWFPHQQVDDLCEALSLLLEALDGALSSLSVRPLLMEVLVVRGHLTGGGGTTVPIHIMVYLQ